MLIFYPNHCVLLNFVAYDSGAGIAIRLPNKLNLRHFLIPSPPYLMLPTSCIFLHDNLSHMAMLSMH